jgi:hypothetical protein
MTGGPRRGVFYARTFGVFTKNSLFCTKLQYEKKNKKEKIGYD